MRHPERYQAQSQRHYYIFGGHLSRIPGSISSMKVSVSLPREDVEFVDKYATQFSNSSRSSIIHQAIGLLRTVDLEDAYTAAWSEWDASNDAHLWDATASDGIIGAQR